MLTVYTLEQCEKWDNIVRSFVDYDVYYLSGYVKAFKIHGDGEPLMFYYEGSNVRGINVVMKRDIACDTHFKGSLPENTYFDLATPYGYGGWIIEGNDNLEALFFEYEKWCQKNNIISEFVRFHPVLKNYLTAEGAYEVIPLGETVAMDTTSPDVIWTNITSKNRNMIRKAEKCGIKIYSGRSEELYEKFTEIYNKTMEHDNAIDYYYFGKAFYDSICYDLPENAQIFYAVAENGEIVAASIMIAANGRLNYHLSGSLLEYRSIAPSNLLLYKAALWGSANGCKSFHLGGGVGSGEDSLFKFKQSFYRGELKRFCIGKKIFMQELYNKLVDMRTDLNESGFFPKYRA